MEIIASTSELESTAVFMERSEAALHCRPAWLHREVHDWPGLPIPQKLAACNSRPPCCEGGDGGEHRKIPPLCEHPSDVGIEGAAEAEGGGVVLASIIGMVLASVVGLIGRCDTEPGTCAF